MDDDQIVIRAAQAHMVKRGGNTIRREDVRHAERTTGKRLKVKS